MGDLFGWALALKGMYRDCAAMNKAKADALRGWKTRGKMNRHAPRWQRHLAQLRHELCKPKAPPKTPLRNAPKRRDSPYRPVKMALSSNS